MWLYACSYGAFLMLNLQSEVNMFVCLSVFVFVFVFRFFVFILCLYPKKLANIFVFPSFGRREVGVVIKNVDITSEEVTVNLNEDMLSKNKGSLQPTSQSDKVLEATVASLDSGKENKKQSVVVALSKYTSIFPEKVCHQLVFAFLFSFHDLETFFLF